MTQVDGGGVPPGTQLNGIYEIVRRIGVGGMGEVYVGREIHSGNQVAIKMVLPDYSRDQLVIDLFRREASTLNQLHHEAIVGYSVFSVDPHLKRPYLAMEFAYGPSLRERLRRGRPLTSEEFEHLKRRTASGLAAAHRHGIVHRDISPDNIILIDDDVERAKIIDFGIAKAIGEEKTLLGDQFAGKMGYAAPEQLGLSGGRITDKTDVYSLGIVFAEALTARSMGMGGTNQVEGIENRKKVPDLRDVPDDYRPLVAAMLDPDPNRRPAMTEIAVWEPEDADSGGGGGGRVLKTLALGVGGIAAAAALIAALWFFLLGGTKLEPPGPEEIAAAKGTVGQSYAWKLPAFKYNGDPAELQLSTADTLPGGLKLTPGKDGTLMISGTPTEAASRVLEIAAVAPDGTRAAQRVAIEIAMPPNTPPRVVQNVTAPVVLTEGQTANTVLGTFDDDTGTGALDIQADRPLPKGLRLVTTGDGAVRLDGLVQEPGTISLDIVATDPAGASARFAVTLDLRAATLPEDPITRFLNTANRDDCFFVRIRYLADNRADLETYAPAPDPILKLDQDFKSLFGYEAQIVGRIVSRPQCKVIDALSTLEWAMFEQDTGIQLPNPSPAPGQLIKGTVLKGADALLFFVDDQGRTAELPATTNVIGRDLEFQARFNGRGPQLVIAAIPTAPGTLAGARGLADVLRPSMRGRVKIAMGYLQVK